MDNLVLLDHLEAARRELQYAREQMINNKNYYGAEVWHRIIDKRLLMLIDEAGGTSLVMRSLRREFGPNF